MKIWKWQQQGLTPVEIIELKSDRPTLIVCGGGFNADNPPQLLGNETPPVTQFFDFMAKHVMIDSETFRTQICGPIEEKLSLSYFIVRKLLGMVSASPENQHYPANRTSGLSDSVEFLEISYTGINETFQNLLRSYRAIDYASDDAVNFVAKLFAPLVRHHRSQNLETLCEKLSLVTLFGVSYGSSFLLEVENALCALLSEVGWDIEAQYRILGSIACLAISNMSNARAAGGPRFTAVYFEGTNDRLAQWLNPHKTKMENEAESGIYHLSDRRVLVLSPVVVTAARWLESIPELDYDEVAADRVGHYIPFYTMRCLPESMLPDLLERVLRNLVFRHRTPGYSIGDLFRPAAPLIPDLDTEPREGDLASKFLRNARWS